MLGPALDLDATVTNSKYALSFGRESFFVFSLPSDWIAFIFLFDQMTKFSLANTLPKRVIPGKGLNVPLMPAFAGVGGCGILLAGYVFTMLL